MNRKSRAMLFVFVVLAGLTWNFHVSRSYAQGYKAANPVTPRVLSGGDIGFRVEGVKGQNPVGRLVVKINDKWVDVEFSSGMSVLTKSQ